MNNEEELSALVDEELDDAAQSQLLDTLSTDSAARGTWDRYHLIGEVLRNGTPAPQQARVVELPRRRASHTPLTGLAIAASVALVAVVFVLGRGPGEPAAISAPAFEVASDTTVAAPAPVARVAESLPAAAPGLAAPPATDALQRQDRRLNGYLVNFNEQRTRVGVPGVHPYVRIVGFESE